MNNHDQQLSHFASVAELAPLLQNGELSPVTLTQRHLSRIEKLNPKLNAFVSQFGPLAMEQAVAAEAEIAAGSYLGSLHGIPVALKDNIDVAGEMTTCCSNAFRDNRASQDAACAVALRNAGAIIIGKTNMHEIAYGAIGNVSCFGPTYNPWNASCNAGGSSSGSAVAVASGMVPVALGSDTGGSIRIPSSACGVTGLKPTFNLVNKKGVMPLSWTLDHVGPITRSAEDARLMLEALTGSTCNTMAQPVRRLGVADFPKYRPEPQVERCFDTALEDLGATGIELERFEVLHAEEAHVSWLAIMFSEATSRYDGVLSSRYLDFSKDVRVQLEAGRYISAGDYLRAQRFRAYYAEYFHKLTQRYDALVIPTLPTIAPRSGQQEVKLPNSTVSTQDAMTYMSLTANLLGWPAMTVPCGFTEQGLPTGMTFVAPAGSDGVVLSLASTYQKSTSWHKHHPALD